MLKTRRRDITQISISEKAATYVEITTFAIGHVADNVADRT